MSRRKVLLGVVALGAAGLGIAAQQLRVAQRAGPFVRGILGTCGHDPGLPDVADSELVSGLIAPEWLDEASEWIVSYPAGMAAETMPVIVVVRGAQGFAGCAFDDNHGLGRFQNHVVEKTGQPFALALVDGFKTLWFDGDPDNRARSLVTEGLFDVLGGLGLSVDRLGLYGWGTGGFGVLGLALELGVDRVAGVGSLAPAIFPSWDFVDGYYDNEEEWRSHDPNRIIDELAAFALRVDCGESDPFADEVRRFRNNFDPALPGAIDPGCRDFRYWHQKHPLMLEFLAERLA